MTVTPSLALKLALALALAAGMLLSLFAEAPRHRVSGAELGKLVLCALGLYLIGGIASLTRHPILAGAVYASGIAVAEIAAWLSRGTDSEGPPGHDEPEDEQPPPMPDGDPQFDWAAFERDFRRYSEREPVGVG
jgi:hypothetical protein